MLKHIAIGIERNPSPFIGSSILAFGFYSRVNLVNLWV